MPTPCHAEQAHRERVGLSAFEQVHNGFSQIQARHFKLQFSLVATQVEILPFCLNLMAAPFFDDDLFDFGGAAVDKKARGSQSEDGRAGCTSRGQDDAAPAGIS